MSTMCMKPTKYTYSGDMLCSVYQMSCFSKANVQNYFQ